MQQERETLDGKAKILFGMWQTLKRYIRTAYPRKKQKEQQFLAGANLYDAAHTGTLADLRDFIKTASQYLAEKSSRLQDSNNMPPAFATQFQALCVDCTKLTGSLMNVENSRRADTGNKTTADNDIYESMMVMLQDGQDIFRNDKTIKRQFVFSSLLKLARGSHPARLKGYVLDVATGKPLQNVTVSAAPGAYTATTDRKGRYDIARIAGGETYTITVEVEGYDPLQQQVTLKPGISKTIRFRLQAMAQQLLGKTG